MFKCHGVGHIASQYANQHAMIIASSGEVVTDDEDEYEDMSSLVEEEMATNEEIGCMVVHKVLTCRA